MSQTNPALLAIVIPAYKTKFLRAALQSIAAQTDQRFQVYVGDDASPEPVETIVREFSGKISVRYQRFNENLGKKSLVGQWQRCLKLANEPWLWLFSDDDLMDAGCVAAFYAELEKTSGQHDVYRFNSVVEKTASRFSGALAEAKPLHPRLQTGREFLCSQLAGDSNIFMQGIIFSRVAWLQVGIPEFPLAWKTDDVFIASLGEPRAICAIAGPCLRWRWSDENISGSKSKLLAQLKMQANLQFCRWAFQFLTAREMPVRDAAKLTEQWFYRQLSGQELFLNRRMIRDTQKLAKECWHRTALSVLTKTSAMNSRLLAKKITRRVRQKLS